MPSYGTIPELPHVAKGSRETRKPAQALKVFYCRLLPWGIGG
jgi:hypothetical protein